MIDVVVADDIVLAEIVAELYFDDLDFIRSEILQAVLVALRDVDGLGARQGEYFVANRHSCGAVDDRPMLAAMLVTLQRQAAAGIDGNALDLEARLLVENMERAP